MLGSCLLPWLPILCGIFLCLFLIPVCILFGYYRHYRGRKDHQIDGIEAVDFRRNRLHLNQRDLGDNRLVINWLSNVIMTLDSDVAHSNDRLHQILGQLNNDLQNFRRIEHDDDDEKGADDNNGENEPLVANMIAHLKQILNLDE